MDHQEIAVQIRQLVAEQRYSEVTPLLHEYAAAVVDQCVHAQDEEQFQAARMFLRSTLDLVKGQRAQDAFRLVQLAREQRYYANNGFREPGVDVSG